MEEQKKQSALRAERMGTDPVGSVLRSMAIPIMISMLVQALYNVVDSIYVAKLGEDALNAVSLAFPLQNTMIAFAGGTGLGMNALLSRYLGAKRQEQADRAACTGIFLSVITAFVFALIGVLFSRPFFRSLTDNESIIAYGTDYATVCLLFSLGLFCQFSFERMLQATGRSRLSMITQTTGAVINIILDPILIFGLLGFPRLEVKGAAIATVAGQIVSAILALILNKKKNADVNLSLGTVLRPSGRMIKEIYRIGFPSILMMSIGSVLNYLLNLILIGFSTAATAVYGAYFKLQNFIFMPVFGLNNAMVPLISYNFGAKKPDRIKKTIRLSVLTALVIMSCGTLLFELFPKTLLGFFSASEEMLSIGVPALRIIAPHFMLAAFCIIGGSVCQSIGNPLHSLVISVCRQLVVLLPAAWLLAQTGRLELVWLAFPLAELVSLALTTVFLKKTLKKADSLQA